MTRTEFNTHLEELSIRFVVLESLIFAELNNTNDEDRHRRMTSVFTFVRAAQIETSECANPKEIVKVLLDLSDRILKYDEDLKNSIWMPIVTGKFDWMTEKILKYIGLTRYDP